MTERYPTSAELRKIKNWKDFNDLHGWLAFIRSCWWMPEWGWTQKKNTYWISTGGWSGNEEIIDAMRSNFLWGLIWVNHRIGGHFKFYVRKIKKAKTPTPPMRIER